MKAKYFLIALAFGTSLLVNVNSIDSVYAQTKPKNQVCKDWWIDSAFNQLKKRSPKGNKNSGECNINRYGGGKWKDYPDLLRKVRGSFLCKEPWVGEAIIEVTGSQTISKPQLCNIKNYGGGRWNSYPDLVNKVREFINSSNIPSKPRIKNPAR